MAHLVAKHPLPHINVALVIALVWLTLAVAASLYDVVHLIQVW
ncbi:MAG TPA: hypothetical protein VGH49_02145 [Xanthobacteraceae bacterium]